MRLLLFGATAEIVGKREIELTIESNSSVEVALARVLQKFPRLANHKLLFSINQQYASDDQIVRDGDELAIFTAVSGG